MNPPLTLLNKLGMKRSGKELMGVSEYHLKSNGLKILLKPATLSDVVALMIVYKVGSRNEAVGHTGATHLLEHMMFKGSRRFNPGNGKDAMTLLSEIGAETNATTSFDRTAYYEVAQSEHLELLIRLEADRMRNLNLRQSDLDSEMSVVRNELEQGENDPSRALAKELFAISFREHPYHHPVIGWESDVEGVSIKRLRQFYQEFYWPNNATVIVTGKFETSEVLELIARHFGKIPRSKLAIPFVHTVEPPQEGERRFTLSRSGGLPELAVAYHVGQAEHSDSYALAVINLLLGSGGNPSGRLYKKLIASGLAISASAAHFELRDPGLFTLWVTAEEANSLPAIEQAVYEELVRLSEEPVPTRELERIKRGLRKNRTLESADPLDFAELLCEGEANADWRWILTYNQHVDALTPEDIRRVAATYFKPSNRTVGYYIPEPGAAESEPVENEETSMPASATEPLLDKEAERSSKTKAAKTAARSRSERTERTGKPAEKPGQSSSYAANVVREILPNGLTVLVMHTPGTGLAAVEGAFYAGDIHAPQDKKVVASLTATMLTRGSANHSKEEMENIFDEMGSGLSFSRDHFRSGFDTMVTIEDLPRLTEMLAEIIRRPSFLKTELDEVKRLALASLVEAASSTEEAASSALMRNLYPEGHPFRSRLPEEKLAELMSVETDDLRSFHAEHYGPQSTILAVVGDIEPSALLELIKQHFGNWSGPPRKPVSIPSVPGNAEATRIDIDIKDKSSVDILLGKATCLSRRAADYFAASIANAALGKDTIVNRLGKAVRVKHGLTYGIYSSFELLPFGAAPWMIELSVAPENVEAALALIDTVLDSYAREGISEAELAREVNRAIGAFAVHMRTPSALADLLADAEFIGMDLSELDKIGESFRALTKADVDAAIARYLGKSDLVTVVAGTLSRQESAA